MINSAPMRANGTKTHVPSAFSSSGFLNADRGDCWLLVAVRGPGGKDLGHSLVVEVRVLWIAF